VALGGNLCLRLVNRHFGALIEQAVKFSAEEAERFAAVEKARAYRRSTLLKSLLKDEPTAPQHSVVQSPKQP
jgi:hypothetical protein